MSPWTPIRSSLDANRFDFEIKQSSAAGPLESQFLMGGVAMAIAIDAVERASEKPLIWATLQFVAAAEVGDTVQIDVARHGGGRSIGQYGVASKVGERLVHTMTAALGARPSDEAHNFIQMPDVSAPDKTSTKLNDSFAKPGNLVTHFERRIAFEDPEAGVEYLWIRPLIDTPVSAGLLAITSDFILGAHASTRGGTSLDNTMRIHALKPTDWILAVTQIIGYANGVSHANQHQFAQDGTLLASSSQTGIIPREPLTVQAL